MKRVDHKLRKFLLPTFVNLAFDLKTHY